MYTFASSVLAKPLNNAQIVRGVFCLYSIMVSQILGQRIFPVGITIFKNKVLSLPYEIRSATSRHPSGCANRQL